MFFIIINPYAHGCKRFPFFVYSLVQIRIKDLNYSYEYLRPYFFRSIAIRLNKDDGILGLLAV